MKGAKKWKRGGGKKPAKTWLGVKPNTKTKGGGDGGEPTLKPNRSPVGGVQPHNDKKSAKKKK